MLRWRAHVAAAIACITGGMTFSVPSHALEEVTAFTADSAANPGALGMFVHIPDVPASALPLPLVVVLHGCQQDEHFALDAGFVALADTYGVALAVPVQRAVNNSLLCFNWFQTEDTDPTGGEAASIAHMVDRLVAHGTADPSRVFVTGLSAGASMAVALLARQPNTFQAGAVFAGVPYGCATSATQAATCMHGGEVHTPQDWAALVLAHGGSGVHWPRLYAWQGEDDTIVAPRNIDLLLWQWTGIHGLSETPSQVTTEGGRQLQHWAVDDRAIVTGVRIEAMGHAQPVDPASGCGIARAFVDDVGVCGAEEAFRFFGLIVPDPDEAQGALESSKGHADAASQGCAEARGTEGAWLNLALLTWTCRRRCGPLRHARCRTLSIMLKVQ